MNPNTIKKWRTVLEALLAKADNAASSPDLNTRRAVAKELQAFIMDNPSVISDDPDTAIFQEMDAIAIKAHDALLLSSIEDRVAAIAGRSAELAGLTKKVAADAAANTKTAKALRLEKAIEVATSVTNTVNAIKVLKAQMEQEIATEADAEKLVAQLGEALEMLQKLRSAVESAG